ncbi:terminase large subunit [Mycobacterium phage HokkenD]|nr:terminase large subunit [Mycobacterium phage Halley]QDM55591.1 terminase large subunit [Mycobacterium phage HokkenD]
MTSSPNDEPSAKLLGHQTPRILYSPEGDTSAGEDAIELAKEFGLELDPWQQLAIIEGLKERPSDGKWAAYEVGLMVSRQNGKGDLGHNTQVLTTDGWVNHGDLKPGQYVYGSDGKPVRIVAVSPEYTDSDCYRVTFTDGSSVIAGGGHLWEVRRKSKKVTEVLATEALAPSVGGPRPDNGRMEYNWRVRCDAMVDSPEADLPIDPYLLGYWLGDGTSKAASITVGHDDEDWVAARIEAAGARIIRRTTHDHGNARGLHFRLDAKMRDGFESRCRRLGIWDNKHIPEIYLTASIGQRKQLLAGLMDSDGSARANTRSTQVEFCTTIPALANGFQTLARGLGIRVTPKVGKSSYRADGALVGCKDRHRFLWTPTFNPFQSPRKSALFAEPVSARQGEMSIVSIEPVPTEPTRCIQVDAEDGIYLVGRSFIPTHNSILEAIELAGLFLFGERLIIHSAHLFATASDAMRRLDTLLAQGGVKYKAVGTHGQERIEILEGPNKGARVMFQSRTKGAGLGFSADRLILDEAMMISPESFQALVPTLISRPNPQIWFTGSAVDQRIHIGCEQFAGLRYRALNSEPGKRICYLEWSAPEDLEDFSDKEAWWMANPGGGIRITEEDIQAEYDSFMAAGGERAFGVQRLGVGDWPLLGASRSEIPLEHWRRLANPEPELTGARALVLYRAPEGGPWAIVGSQRCTDGRIHLEVGYTGEDSVDRVVGMFVQAVTAWGPEEVLVGRGGAAEVIPQLEALGFSVYSPNQTEEAQACGGFLNDAMVDPEDPLLSHGDQTVLNTGISRAIKKDLPSGGFVWDCVDQSSYAQLMGATLGRWALLKHAVNAAPTPTIHDWPDQEEIDSWINELYEEA